MDNRWARINAAFSEILTCDATERSVVMDRWCAEDAEMRDRLCAMIDAHDRMGAFLEDSAFRGDPTRGTSHLSSRMRGTRIGPYELLSLIGFGGEGAVFEVRSDGASDRFALKLLHRRCVADEGALRAWRREAGVLAGLSHPAIAGFVDAGVSVEGAPYIVMERAAGVPLNRVTFNGDAALTRRIELMLVVCDAISFAHRNGVIHRDLKPTNVLVDWRSDDRAPEAVAPGDSPVGSVVKIVDFGLATPISDDGAMNCSMSIALRGAGTLAYMSPERVREPMAAADVRGDVYSIGAMLYELLTGECPHNLSDLGFAAAVLQVCEADIERPARLNRSLQGDLEAILLKALARRSADRYGAVDELAEDLRRYLRREPVSAMRAGVLYDVRRFVSRHRAASALAAGAMALLVGVSIWLAVLYSRADSAEQDARRMAKASQDATSLLLWVLMNAAPSEGPAGDVPVYEVMKTLATELDRGDFDPLIEGEMRHRIGVIFRERGDYPEAERNLSIAAELVAQHLGSDSPQAANCDVALAGLRIAQSQRPDPDRLNHAVDVLRRHAESEAWVRPELAMALQALAHQDFAQERFHEAEAHAREAVQWMGDPDNLSDTRRKLGLQIDLARVLVSLHRTDEADAIYEASLQLAESMLPEDDLLVGTLSEHMASRCLRDQNYAPAETHTARAIEIYEKRLPAGHATTANAYLLRGHIHRARKRYAEAMSDYRKSAAMQAAIHGPTARPVLNVEYAIAKCAEGMGDYDEAVDRFTLVRNEMKSQFPQNAMAIARIEAALKQANDKRDAAQVVAADE